MEKELIIKDVDFSTKEVIPECGSVVDISNKFVFIAKKMITLDSRGGYTKGCIIDTSGTSRANANFVECRGARYIEISMPVYSSASTQALSFYNADSTKPNPYITNSEIDCCSIEVIARPQGEKGKRIVRFAIPTDAKYVRTTWFGASDEAAFGAFECRLYY